MVSSLSDYSVLNNYNYEGKPCFSSVLDWLSTPCRRVLGGKTVYVMSQTMDMEMTTAAKVMTAVFSILIFPIGVISVISFLIKLATLPWFWEKKR